MSLFQHQVMTTQTGVAEPIDVESTVEVPKLEKTDFTLEELGLTEKELEMIRASEEDETPRKMLDVEWNDSEVQTGTWKRRIRAAFSFRSATGI